MMTADVFHGAVVKPRVDSVPSGFRRLGLRSERSYIHSVDYLRYA
jgi:hypothetical protein